MEEHWVKTLINSLAVKIIAFSLLFLLVILVITGIFTNKNVKIFGIEFNNRDTIVKYVNSNEDTSRIVNDTIRKIKVISNIKTHSQKVNFKADSLNSNYVFNEKIEAENLQIGNQNTQNNYGIQPRKISEDFLKDFFEMYPDITMHIGFVAPNSEGEIINVKNQIIKILKTKGYIDIEKVNGIRIMIDSNLSSEKITLLPNSIGGISFYIPSATK